MSLADEIDDRSTAEQLRDLGLEVVKKGAKQTVTDVKWVHRYSRRQVPTVNINEKQLYFNTIAAPLVKAGRQKYAIGAATLKPDQIRVLLMRPDDKGRKLTLGTKGGAQAGGKKLCPGLLAAGLQTGLYELRKAEAGCWIGLPMSEEGVRK